MQSQEASGVNAALQASVNAESAEARQACSELNAKGKPCRSTSVGPSGKCAFHDGKSPLGTAEGARKAAKRSAEVRAEKAERRRMNGLDFAAKLVEEDGQEIYECYKAAIKAG